MWNVLSVYSNKLWNMPEFQSPWSTSPAAEFGGKRGSSHLEEGEAACPPAK